MRMIVLSKNILNRLLGCEFDTNRCGKCFIIDYQSCTNVTVIFQKPICIVKCSLSNLRKGQVTNPILPRVYGVGFVGIGEYGYKDRKLYKLWNGMLERAYSSKLHKKHQTYESVEVCKSWHNFQNFAEWCVTQEFFGRKDCYGRYYNLDKDILVKGNKIYSPETCSFIPQEINTLLINGGKNRGDFPIGVHLVSSNHKFKAQLSCLGKRLGLGTFSTKDEAFQAYKKAKESYIKEVANKWRGQITPEVYESLMKWTIEATD